MEPKGMTPDIVEKLNEKAKVLTVDRRKKTKMVPEELMSADSIRYTANRVNNNQSLSLKAVDSCFCFAEASRRWLLTTASTLPRPLAFWPWTSTSTTTARF